VLNRESHRSFFVTAMTFTSGMLALIAFFSILGCHLRLGEHGRRSCHEGLSMTAGADSSIINLAHN
jgi:hypothetical protein